MDATPAVPEGREPERREDASRVPATVSSSAPVEPPPAPVEPTRDIGWVVMMTSATLALLGSWVLFPPDGVGMWAGYWVSSLATLGLVAAFWLRSTLPAGPAVVLGAIAGGVMALLGALRDYPTTVAVIMVAGGAGIAVGALMQTVRRAARGW